MSMVTTKKNVSGVFLVMIGHQDQIILIPFIWVKLKPFSFTKVKTDSFQGLSADVISN